MRDRVRVKIKIEIKYHLPLRQNRWKGCTAVGLRQTSCIRKSCNDENLGSRRIGSPH